MPGWADLKIFFCILRIYHSSGFPYFFLKDVRLSWPLPIFAFLYSFTTFSKDVKLSRPQKFFFYIPVSWPPDQGFGPRFDFYGSTFYVQRSVFILIRSAAVNKECFDMLSARRLNRHYKALLHGSMLLTKTAKARTLTWVHIQQQNSSSKFWATLVILIWFHFPVLQVILWCVLSC